MDNNGVVDILAGAPPAGISTPPVYPPARVASMVVDISPSHNAFRPMQPIDPPPAHVFEAHLAVKPKLMIDRGPTHCVHFRRRQPHALPGTTLVCVDKLHRCTRRSETEAAVHPLGNAAQ